MEMSHGYMRQTVEAMRQCGWAVSEKKTDYGDGAVGHAYVLRASEAERLILETVIYPSVAERYYLEIEAYHGLRSFSFQLDSWKHFKDRVEFKYYSHPETNTGLSFVLTLNKL